MIRKHLVVAVATLSFAGMFGCSATVKAPSVAVAVPEPVAVVEAPPPPPAPPPPRLTTVCDAEIRPQGHLHFPHEVEFDTGKATLKSTPTTNAILQCLVDFLANNKMVTKFRLDGYTDNAGDPAANLTLSQHRADAVIAWMTAHGADGSRMWAKGYGVARPMFPNDSPEHMAQNRRVEFHIDELNGVKATKENIYLAMNPPMPVVVAAAPMVGVATVGVAVPTVAVGMPTVAVATPGVAVVAPGVAVGGGMGMKGAVAAPGVAVGVAVPTGVSVGVGVGGAPGKGAPAKADAKDDKKKK